MKVLLTNTFKLAAKKLHRNQISALEGAIHELQNPMLSELKVGDLAGVRVYKFHIQHQLILLAYVYNEIMSVGSVAPRSRFLLINLGSIRTCDKS